jgi:sugar phosphate isomerase/epimerase
MNQIETDILAAASVDEPWSLVESFATFKREHPNDVNRGMDEVVERLRKHGVEVTVHEPSLYLSLPGAARVEAGLQHRCAQRHFGRTRLCGCPSQRHDHRHVRAEDRDHG